MHLQQIKTLLQADAETLKSLSHEMLEELARSAHEHITTLETQAQEAAKNAKKLVLG